MITEGLLKRFKKDIEAVTQEPMEVEFIKGALYAYGSELATLRLLKRYKHCIALGTVGADYSSNKGTHYFYLETKL